MATSVVPKQALLVWKEYISRYSFKLGRKLLRNSEIACREVAEGKVGFIKQKSTSIFNLINSLWAFFHAHFRNYSNSN